MLAMNPLAPFAPSSSAAGVLSYLEETDDNLKVIVFEFQYHQIFLFNIISFI